MVGKTGGKPFVCVICSALISQDTTQKVVLTALEGIAEIGGFTKTIIENGDCQTQHIRSTA